MPEISRFLGIVIGMYYKDHNPPHFHAYYGEHDAAIVVQDGAVLSGSLPRRAMAHVQELATGTRRGAGSGLAASSSQPAAGAN